MEQEALTELLRCQDLYALQPQHFADYDLDKLRVPKGGVLPKDVVDLVSPSLAELLKSLRVPSRRTGIPRCVEIRASVMNCFTSLLTRRF